MKSPYCGAKHSDGWLCVLTYGHVDDHLSIDNRSMWKGTVGRPIKWSAPISKKTTSSTPMSLPGFTGIPCDSCGGPNTFRSGKCLTCIDCRFTGECG